MKFFRKSRCQRDHRLFLPLAFVALLTLGTGRSVRAADQTKADNNIPLNTGTSWVGGTAPGGSDRAIWDSTVATPANCTNTYSGNPFTGQIAIKNPSAPVDLGGSGIYMYLSGVNGVGIDMSQSTVDLTMEMNVQPNNSSGLIFTNTAGRTLTFVKGLLPQVTTPLTFAGGGDYLLKGGVARNGAQVVNLIKSGAGVLTFSNTVAAPSVTLNAGTLNLNHANALNANGNSLNFTNNGGTLDNTSGSAITLANSSVQYYWNGDLTFAGTSSLNLGSGAVTLGGNRQVICNANTLTAGGVVGDGGSGYSLTKAGAGTLTLAGVNTYSGSTLINGGKLALSGGGSLANSPLISLAGGATLDVSGRTAAATLVSGQTLQAGGSTSSATLATTTGKGLTLASTSPLQFPAFKPAGSGGAVPLTLSGAGTLTLGASSPVLITIANGGAALTAAGSPYKLIAKGASGLVATLPGGILTVNGDGANGTASLTIINSELYLVITGSSLFTTTALTLTSGDPTYGNINGLSFTATVRTNGIAAGNATSNFVFSVDGVPVATNAVASGSATYTTPANLVVGSHLITAQYKGDVNYKPSTNTLTQTVNPLPVGLTGSRAYDGTTNAAYGILSITNLHDGDNVFPVAGSAGLAGANIGVQAIVSPNTLTLGGAQAANYTVAGLTGSVLITKTSSSLWLTSSVQPGGWQQPVTFTASVQNNGLLAGDATGSVTFLTNGVPLSTNNLVAGTTFSLTTTNLPSGTNLITALYSGDANYNGSTNTLSQLVLPPQTNSVTFSNSLMAITISTNGTVTSVKCIPTGGEMLSSSPGFYIYHQIDNTTIALNHMVQLNNSQLRIWSDNGLYTATFNLTNAVRYFKIELAHVSNNPQTGDIDSNWPGYEVVLSLNLNPPSGYALQNLKLDYMTEFPYYASWNHNYNFVNIHWQNVQYSQRPNPCVVGTGSVTFTVTNSEPMGAVGFYLFRNDMEHDDILMDMWSGETCMARPNQANLKSWTRADIWAWLDRYERELSSFKELAFIPSGTPNTSTTNEFYQIADKMYADGFDRLLLWNCWGESPSLDSISTSWFAGGAPGMKAYKDYCAQRGIRLNFHAMSGFLSLKDPDYGAASANGLSPQVSRWATGTLLNDIDSSSTSFNVLPDTGCQMLIHGLPWGSSSTAIYYPPYYYWAQSLVSISNDVLYAQATAVNSTNWGVSGVNRQYIGQYGQQWGTSHKAGSRVDFLNSYYGTDTMCDSRSDLLVSLASRYGNNVLNMFNLVDACYDGMNVNLDLGNWGYGKFATRVQQSVDHPTTSSYAGNVTMGHFEDVFRRIQKTTPSYTGSAYYIRTSVPTFIAPNVDEMNFSFGRSAAKGQRFTVLGGHIGSTFNMINNFGLWDQLVANMNIWMALSPRLSASQRTALAAVSYDFFEPTVSGNQWLVTPKWVMARPTADEPFLNIQEFGMVSPRQFNKVGDTIIGLTNKYAAQTPEIELLVLPGMSATNANNVSLMPVNGSQIVHPTNEMQSLTYSGGVINFSVTNNTGSQAIFTASGNQSYWLYSTLYGPSSFNMNTNRGIALTVVGDNSGADLVFRINAQGYLPDSGSLNSDYVVPINFSGPRTIEIPNGQVMYYKKNPYGFWSDYSTVGGGAGYDAIVLFQVYMGKVPANTTATVQISAITAMKEDRVTGLANPTLMLNGNSVSITGTIPYNNYLTYSGGVTAQVYDENWHFKTNLAVSGGVLMVNSGSNNTFSVTAASSPNTWLSTRIKTSGTPWVIPMPMPTHEWRFENNALDCAGTANGFLINAPAYVAGIEGVAALTLNGVNQYVSVATLSDFQFASNQSFTISAWVKLNSLPNARVSMVQTDPASGAWYGLGITAANQWAFFGTTDIVSPFTADAGQWHLLAAVQDGDAGSRKLFVDGLLITTGLAQAASGSGALGIGAAPGAAPSQFFNGTIDDVRLYNQALTQSDFSLLTTNLASAPNSIITYSVSGGQLVLNWPANQLWQLQMQTNNIGMGLTTNWFTVTGAAPPYPINIDPARPTVFYRLTHP